MWNKSRNFITLQIIAKLCRKNIEKYNQEFVKKQTNGWKILIEQEQRELEMLMEFIKVLDR